MRRAGTGLLQTAAGSILSMRFYKRRREVLDFSCNFQYGGPFPARVALRPDRVVARLRDARAISRCTAHHKRESGFIRPARQFRWRNSECSLPKAGRGRGRAFAPLETLSYFTRKPKDGWAWPWSPGSMPGPHRQAPGPAPVRTGPAFFASVPCDVRCGMAAGRAAARWLSAKPPGAAARPSSAGRV
jgi:hypothetical protein